MSAVSVVSQVAGTVSNRPSSQFEGGSLIENAKGNVYLVCDGGSLVRLAFKENDRYATGYGSYKVSSRFKVVDADHVRRQRDFDSCKLATIELKVANYQS